MSVEITVDLSKLNSYCEATSKGMDEAVLWAIEENAPVFQQEAQFRAPVRTGRLRASIIIERQPDKVLIGPTVDYAPYVIRGTRPSPGRYVPAIERRLVDPEHPSFGTHPGIAPNPFLEQAADAGKGHFLDQIRRRVTEFVVGSVSGG